VLENYATTLIKFSAAVGIVGNFTTMVDNLIAIIDTFAAAIGDFTTILGNFATTLEKSMVANYTIIKKIA
jgi:hypothetical protein